MTIEKLKKLEKTVNLIFIIVSSIIICFATSLAVYFSVKYGYSIMDEDGEEAKADNYNSTDWYNLQTAPVVVETFPFSSATPDVTYKNYSDNIQIKYSTNTILSTNFCRWRVSQNTNNNTMIYLIEIYNGVGNNNLQAVNNSTLHVNFYITKDNNNNSITGTIRFYYKDNSSDPYWTQTYPTSPEFKFGNSWLSQNTTEEQNIYWCISQFLYDNTTTFLSGYYLFPDIATIDTYAHDMNISNAKLLIYSDDTIDETGTYKTVAYTEYNLISFHYSSNTLALWGNSDNISINITNNNEFKQFFPILYITQDTQVIQTDFDFLDKFIPINNELIGELLLPIIQDGVMSAYNSGYNDGYDTGIGQSIISDSTEGVISALFHGLFGNIFMIEIFPNFPLYIFILIPVVFAVLSLILWLMRGK